MELHNDHKALSKGVSDINTALVRIQYIALGGLGFYLLSEIGFVELLKTAF